MAHQIDPRNKLNDLKGNEWLKNSTSVWMNSLKQSLLINEAVTKLISLFSKKGMNILASNNDKFKNSIQALERNYSGYNDTNVHYAFFIFRFNRYKILKDKHEYSDFIETYKRKILRIEIMARKLYQRLQDKKYISVITNDFFINNLLFDNSMNIIRIFQKVGFIYKGKVILTNRKTIFNILNFQKQLDVLIDYFPRQLDIIYPKYEKITKYKNFQLSLKYPHIFISKTKTDEIGKLHPSTYSYLDIERLLNIFTYTRDKVLDPFVGVGSTLVACGKLNRCGWGIDLNPEYIEKSKQRLSKLRVPRQNQKLIVGNSLIKLKDFENGFFKYCVTSPPYHNILRTRGNGVRADNSQFRQGVVYYSEAEEDIGNKRSYQEYLEAFKEIMAVVHKKLKKRGICSIVISDFTVDKKETNVVGDISQVMEVIGYTLLNHIILYQDQKVIYPFGYPYSYVINHVHQTVLNFVK